MSDGNQENKLAETNKEQQGGWFSSPKPQPSSTSGREPHGFFDRPPLLFAALVWFLPVSYFIFFGFALSGMLLTFHVYGAKLSDFIPLGYMQGIFSSLPLLFCLFMLIQSKWFLKRILFLIPVWIVLIEAMGITQGSMMSALSRVYGVEH